MLSLLIIYLKVFHQTVGGTSLGKATHEQLLAPKTNFDSSSDSPQTDRITDERDFHLYSADNDTLPFDVENNLDDNLNNKDNNLDRPSQRGSFQLASKHGTTEDNTSVQIFMSEPSSNRERPKTLSKDRNNDIHRFIGKNKTALHPEIHQLVPASSNDITHYNSTEEFTPVLNIERSNLSVATNTTKETIEKHNAANQNRSSEDMTLESMQLDGTNSIFYPPNDIESSVPVFSTSKNDSALDQDIYNFSIAQNSRSGVVNSKSQPIPNNLDNSEHDISKQNIFKNPEHVISEQNRDISKNSEHDSKKNRDISKNPEHDISKQNRNISKNPEQDISKNPEHDISFNSSITNNRTLDHEHPLSSNHSSSTHGVNSNSDISNYSNLNHVAFKNRGPEVLLRTASIHNNLEPEQDYSSNQHSSSEEVILESQPLEETSINNDTSNLTNLLSEVIEPLNTSRRSDSERDQESNDRVKISNPEQPHLADESSQPARRSNPRSRLPDIPQDQPTEDSKVRANITNEELREIIAHVRSGRVAPVRFDNGESQGCTTPEEQPGSCTPLVGCQYVLETYRRQTPNVCRFEGDMPIVCCPRLTMYRNTELTGCGRRSIPGLRASRAAARGPKGTIAGGIEAQPGAWPWMAGIYLRNQGVGNFICGATLISDRHLLTAAHCFRTRGSAQVSPTRFAIQLGSIVRQQGKMFPIEAIVVHPRYVPRYTYNDIAVIRLRDPLDPLEPGVQPICLPQDFQGRRLAGRDVTVVGWGDQGFGGKRSPVLREVTIQVVDIPNCDKALESARNSFPQGITRQFICAGVPEGGKDACQEDSGGPLMLLEDGAWYLVGVVSFGLGCGSPGVPGVYTRVSHFLEWIEEVASPS